MTKDEIEDLAHKFIEENYSDIEEYWDGIYASDKDILGNEIMKFIEYLKESDR